jgi:hypothetical protein
MYDRFLSRYRVALEPCRYPRAARGRLADTMGTGAKAGRVGMTLDFRGFRAISVERASCPEPLAHSNGPKSQELVWYGVGTHSNNGRDTMEEEGRERDGAQRAHRLQKPQDDACPDACRGRISRVNWVSDCFWPGDHGGHRPFRGLKSRFDNGDRIFAGSGGRAGSGQ